MTDNPPGASDKRCYRTPSGATETAANPQISDVFLINAWLHGRPATTSRAYRRDAAAFLAHAGKPLSAIEVTDLQAWDTSLATSAPASRARNLAAVRSLLAYGLQLGFLSVDPGRQIRVAKPATGAIRVLTEADVQRMIGAETDPRARTALRVLYVTGLRNAELCALRRRDLVATKKGGEIRFTGKGNKPRTVAVPSALFREVLELSAKPEDPAIPGRDGKPLYERALHRLVRRAARRAGLVAVSPHWLRHAHASHALDRGAPPHVVQQTLGHASLATTTRYLHVRAGDSSSGYLPV